MTICETIISIKPPAEAMIPKPATCPAEVMFVAETSTACHQESPEATARMPKEKETER